MERGRLYRAQGGMAGLDAAQGNDCTPAGGCRICRWHAAGPGQSARRTDALSLPERQIYALYDLQHDHARDDRQRRVQRLRWPADPGHA